MRYCFNFRLKIISCACFVGSGLKLILKWNAHLFIFAKSLFSSIAEVLLSWITEKKDVSSENSLAFEDNPSDKSLIYIKYNNGPSIEPWGTSTLTSDQSETCPLNKIFSFLFLRKSHKRFSKLPDIPFCFNLKMIPSFQTLSNAFDISWKTPLTWNLLSNDLYISWVIAKSWFMQGPSQYKLEITNSFRA